MANQETPAEVLMRKAREQQAANAANTAVKKADDAAAVDPKVAANKAEQDRQEAQADLEARQQAASELLKNTPAVPGISNVTSNAAGAPVPKLALQDVRPAEIPLTSVDSSLARETAIEAPWRTFQHLYANANTIMPNGKKLIFGGQNGHIGTYSTNVQAQIEHLAELANTPGSMVTEVRRDGEGRYIVVTDAILQAETLAALSDSRTNTARQQDPNVAQAMNNLGRTIAQDS